MVYPELHFTGQIWRPPYEASSQLLQVTSGCTLSISKQSMASVKISTPAQSAHFGQTFYVNLYFSKLVKEHFRDVLAPSAKP